MWPFDEGMGKAIKNFSSNRNDGEIKGSKWVNGKYGKALACDGLNAMVEIHSSKALNITQSITGG